MNLPKALTEEAMVYWLRDKRGMIVWRWGTGDNVEITHLKASRPGRGEGRSLLRDMLAILLEDPPYATVFGFTRSSNLTAHAFYKKAGFVLSPVAGVYADGDAIVFSANYVDLCQFHRVGPCQTSSNTSTPRNPTAETASSGSSSAGTTTGGKGSRSSRPRKTPSRSPTSTGGKGT